MSEDAMQQAQERARTASGAAPEMGSGPDVKRTSAGEKEIVLNPVRARQGVTGHHVRLVLGFGIAAVVVLFVAAFYLVATGSLG